MVNSEEDDLKSILSKILVKFTEEQIQQLLKYIRDWNTSAKYSNIAERVLSVLFTTFQPAKLEKIPQVKEVTCY